MILFSAPSFPRKKKSLLLLLFRELFEILLLLVRNDRNDYPSLQADGGMGGWVGGPLRRGVDFFSSVPILGMARISSVSH